VATYAPANYNMTQPTNRKIPIAYYQTTGTTDGTCPWVNNDAQKRAGNIASCSMSKTMAARPPLNLKLATGGTHVTTRFQGMQRRLSGEVQLLCGRTRDLAHGSGYQRKLDRKRSLGVLQAVLRFVGDRSLLRHCGGVVH
jgi:hypothetical protein